ncbi:MAG: hypothetical protein HQL86_09125 [Magnetococcales bacterium]|nr:hypothetical protein [Magnetococcales bacterium]
MVEETISPAMQRAIRLHITRTWQHFHVDFIKTQLPAVLIPDVRINLSILMEAIEHAFIDIHRMAAWHLPMEDRRPDRHKWSGFMAKWIAKTRPIYCNFPARGDSESVVNMLNAHFALYVFRCFLQCKSDSHHEILAKNLLYAFHYRDERGETLALLAYCYEEMARP